MGKAQKNIKHIERCKHKIMQKTRLTYGYYQMRFCQSQSFIIIFA